MTTLIIDCNNIAYSSFHTFGELSFEEKKTGVIFGFLQRVLFLAKKFETNKFIFTWDTKKNYRKIIYPEYKQNRRKDLTEQEKIDYALAFKQFDELRLKVLPGLGFGNIFWQNGYEADDLIAYIVLEKRKEYKGPFYIVSTDKDLYQLLNVCDIYNQRTKKIITKKTFTKLYDISPSIWFEVKSMMGDSGDNIIGIEGVGEKKAIQYVKGTLPKGKILSRIEESKDLIKRNVKLIDIPYRGVKPIRINFKEDSFGKEKFIDVFMDFGFESFLKKKELDSWVKTFCKNQF